MTSASIRNPANLPLVIELTKSICATYAKKRGALLPTDVSVIELPGSNKLLSVTAVNANLFERFGGPRILGTARAPEFAACDKEMFRQLLSHVINADFGEGRESGDNYVLEDYDDFFKESR